MPVFSGFGAPSTISFASFKPRLVSSLTTLMTWIFLSPAPTRITSNAVFSSAGAAPAAAPGAAAATGAAAVTPYFSSIFFTNSASSITFMLSI